MNMLLPDNFDDNYVLLAPLARSIAIASTDVEDVLNLTKFYERIYVQSVSIYRKLVVSLFKRHRDFLVPQLFVDIR